LLAARYSNQIPLRYSLIKKVASLDLTEKQFNEAIAHLASTNFLEIQQLPSDEKVVAQSASTALATCTSEAEQRQSREEGEADKTSVELKLDGPLERVFEHWRQEFRHPKAVLDPKRRKAIQRALETHDEATLRQAISGYKLSPHHMGQNEQRTVYDDIALFLRDAEHIERGLNCARAPPVVVRSAVEIARERLRNGNGNGRVVSEQYGESGEPSLGEAVGALRRLAAP
jgi:hypothetical protein